jgi:hypothetical protein
MLSAQQVAAAAAAAAAAENNHDEAAAAAGAGEAAPAPAPAAVRRHTGAAAPWTRAQDEALRAAVAAHGRAWTRIRADVEHRGLYAPLAAHLGAPDSKCLRKRADKLATWDAAGVEPTYRD